MNKNLNNGKLPDREDSAVDTLEEETEQIHVLMSTHIVPFSERKGYTAVKPAKTLFKCSSLPEDN